MKAIVCEMCGSQDLVKQDGYYVCQNCGTKYDPEEAKKLMVEIKIDNSEKIKNLYQLARRAYEDKNYEDAANYYQQITVDIPEDWEAYFYSVLCKQSTTKVMDIPLAVTTVSNCLDTTAELIENSKLLDQEKQNAYLKISKAVDTFAGNCTFSSGNAYLNPPFTDIAKRGMHDCTRAIQLLVIKEKSVTEPAIKGKLGSVYVQACKNAIEMHNMLKSSGVPDLFSAEELRQLQSRAKEIDPSFTVPSNTNGNTGSGGNKSGGCYVATAVYGSYDCPQVWTLRRYRDDTLAETWYGRAFIHSYYAISPTLVKWFGETEWFKNMWKPKLDKMVKKLNEKGVADTPYRDRNW